jgi:nicotinamidase-related amidase
MAAAPFPLEPERQALLVVDMQNDFVRRGAPQEVPDARVTIPVIAGLLDAFRAAQRPVIFTRFSAGPQRTLLWNWSPQCGPELRSCWPGVSRAYDDGEELVGHDVVPELEPLDGETVVDKYGYGSFHNTMLEDVLRARAATQVVAVGTVTQICVEETVREGFHRGLEMVMVRDAVSSFDPELHRATLRNIEMKFGRVEAASTVLAALNRLKPSAQLPMHERWSAGPAT